MELSPFDYEADSDRDNCGYDPEDEEVQKAIQDMIAIGMDEKIVFPTPPPDDIYKEKSRVKPLKNVTPRFQFFRGRLRFVNHKKYQVFNLSGHITIFNRSAAYDRNVIFNRPSDDPLPFVNNYFLLPLATQGSILVYAPPLDIVIDIIAVTPDHDDDKVHLRNDPNDFKLPVENFDTFYTHQINGGPGGFLELRYIVLSDPVDASVEITFHPDFDVNGRLFTMKVWAYYDETYGPISLLNVDQPVTLSKNCKIALSTSSVAVPASGYNLLIRGMIFEEDLFEEEKRVYPEIYIDQSLYLTPKLNGSSTGCIHGKNSRFEVRVNWKYEADTEENDDEIYTCKECEELKNRDEPATSIEVQKKHRKKKKTKKKKKVNVNEKCEVDTEQNDDEIQDLTECEDLETRDVPTVEVQQQIHKGKEIAFIRKHQLLVEGQILKAQRIRIHKKIMKIRNRKEKMTRMDVNWKYTEDEEKSLLLVKRTEGSRGGNLGS